MSNIVPIQDMQTMAKAIAESKLFGISNEQQALALMAVAQAEGLHPATAARDYHIVQGRPALRADAMLARFQAAGGRVNWDKYTDTEVCGTFTHPNGGSLSVSWTMQRAQEAQLLKSGSGWQKYPRAMLRSRCISEGIRAVFPGSVTGFYSVEEVQDFDDKKPSKKAAVDVEAVIKEVVNDSTGEIENTKVIEVREFIENKHKTFDDMPDSELDIIPLMVPDSEVPGQSKLYASYNEWADWIAAFGVIAQKIQHSGKLSQDEKVAKIEQLKEANAGVIKKLSAKDRAELISATAKKD